MLKNFDALISDADGCLVDTASLIRHGQYEAASTFLTNHGVPDEQMPTFEEYEPVLNQHVGGSTRQTLERTVRALYRGRDHHLDGVDYDELNSLLNPVQDRIAPEFVRAFPGLPGLLNALGANGKRLAIFTSGSPHHVVRNFGIALSSELGDLAELYKDKTIDDSAKLDMFTDKVEAVFGIPKLVVITCDDVGSLTKPNPLAVNMALERLGVSKDRAVGLGDHAYDMVATRDAGIEERIGVTHGFDDEILLRDAGATTVVSSLTRVSEILMPTT